ncbi:MAG: Eco57I restriction-modification methylase domain-containing protein [Pseudomonadota bacterium]
MSLLEPGTGDRGASRIIPIETELLSVLRALLPHEALLSSMEKEILAAARPADPAQVAAARRLIEQGDDPLGDVLCRLRTQQERRARGAIYTPTAIVRSMVAWAAAQDAAPDRIIDPGVGTGRFLLRAGAEFPSAQLVAIDIDPLALLILRANAAVLGMEGRLSVHCEDYRRVDLPAIAGRSLFIGNPPYVRHHDIDAAGKAWFAHNTKRLGLKASNLAGLHIHFFVRTRQLAQSGDLGAFITSAEWLDVNYGSTLRQMLMDGLGGTGLHVLAPDTMPFDATTTGAITCFHVGHRPNAFTVRSVTSIDALGRLDKGNLIAWKTVEQTHRWSCLMRGVKLRQAGHIELGELFRVHRGQVTGKNSVWIEGAYRGSLPASVLFPTITRADELFAAGPALARATHLKRVIDIPGNLAWLNENDRALVDDFLKWAKAQGADQGYIAQHRKRWWSVGLREAAPILCTYMARRPPAFVLNTAGVRHINIAHGLYPREALAPSILEGVARFLRANVSLESGRTYAGGLTKFEPKEIERLIIPHPDNLHAST